MRDYAGTAVPVNLAGRFAPLGEGEETCRLDSSETAAWCPLGRGNALIFADAALLDIADPHPGAGRALHWLLEHAMGTARETPVLDANQAENTEEQ
jgi:hypothetical protein